MGTLVLVYRRISNHSKGENHMEENFIRERITKLRIQKNVSEYKMSLDLGHSKSYMQSISSGRAMPSWTEFLYICEYLGTTPKEFFDEDLSEPSLSHELAELTKQMSKEDIEALITTAKRIVANKK